MPSAHSLDPTALQKLPLVRCAAGDVLIREGEPLTGLYFLEEGELEVIKGETLLADVHEPGAVLGDMAFLLGTLPTATVRAVTDSTLRHVKEPQVFLREHPELALNLAAVLARRVDSLNRYLIEIKKQFEDRADHLGMIDQVLDALIHKHPRSLPRRSAGT